MGTVKDPSGQNVIILQDQLVTMVNRQCVSSVSRDFPIVIIISYLFIKLFVRTKEDNRLRFNKEAESS